MKVSQDFGVDFSQVWASSFVITGVKFVFNARFFQTLSRQNALSFLPFHICIHQYVNVGRRLPSIQGITYTFQYHPVCNIMEKMHCIATTMFYFAIPRVLIILTLTFTVVISERCLLYYWRHLPNHLHLWEGTHNQTRDRAGERRWKLQNTLTLSQICRRKSLHSGCE